MSTSPSTTTTAWIIDRSTDNLEPRGDPKLATNSTACAHRAFKDVPGR
jgi:hypothetical protein